MRSQVDHFHAHFKCRRRATASANHTPARIAHLDVANVAHQKSHRASNLLILPVKRFQQFYALRLINLIERGRGGGRARRAGHWVTCTTPGYSQIASCEGSVHETWGAQPVTRTYPSTRVLRRRSGHTCIKLSLTSIFSPSFRICASCSFDKFLFSSGDRVLRIAKF